MPSFPASSVPLEVFLLGLVEYEDIQQLQRRLVYELSETERSGALILCEHPPTISVGRSGSRMHIRPDPDVLKGAGIDVHWVNRGGGCVLHLPGQLSAYVLLPLRTLGLDLGVYLERLRGTVLDVLGEFDLGAEAEAEEDGVFLGASRVATIAVAVNRWITQHGLSLNVGPYLGAFDLLDPPAPAGRSGRPTSMEARRQRPTSMAKVRESFIRHLEARFGLERHFFYTSHPLVPGKVRPHVLAPSLR